MQADDRGHIWAKVRLSLQLWRQISGSLLPCAAGAAEPVLSGYEPKGRKTFSLEILCLSSDVQFTHNARILVLAGPFDYRMPSHPVWDDLARLFFVEVGESVSV